MLGQAPVRASAVVKKTSEDNELETKIAALKIRFQPAGSNVSSQTIERVLPAPQRFVRRYRRDESLTKLKAMNIG